MIAPKDESSELVMQWLDAEGLSSQASKSPRQDSIIVDASVAQVEELLQAEYSAFSEFNVHQLNCPDNSSPNRDRRKCRPNLEVQPPKCAQRSRRHGPAYNLLRPASHEIHNLQPSSHRTPKRDEDRSCWSSHWLQRKHDHPEVLIQPLQLRIRDCVQQWLDGDCRLPEAVAHQDRSRYLHAKLRHSGQCSSDILLHSDQWRHMSSNGHPRSRGQLGRPVRSCHH